MYYCCGMTDRGAVRENNEDAFLISRTVYTEAQAEKETDVPFIAAVADGVGGENAGEIASRLSLEQLSAVKMSRRTDISAKLMNIHKKLRRYGKLHHEAANMQTTLCALAVDEDERAYVINIGDSRMYRMRGGKIRQLSTDQSLVQLLYEQGRISVDEKKHHAQRNIIMPVLGNSREDPTPEISEIDGGIQKGDLIVLCSDGLSDYITTGEFENILSEPMHISRRLKKLTEAAIKNGSPDNITVMAISSI